MHINNSIHKHSNTWYHTKWTRSIWVAKGVWHSLRRIFWLKLLGFWRRLTAPATLQGQEQQNCSQQSRRRLESSAVLLNKLLQTVAVGGRNWLHTNKGLKSSSRRSKPTAQCTFDAPTVFVFNPHLVLALRKGTGVHYRCFFVINLQHEFFAYSPNIESLMSTLPATPFKFPICSLLQFPELNVSTVLITILQLNADTLPSVFHSTSTENFAPNFKQTHLNAL